MITSPQQICNKLNEMTDKHPELISAIRSRVPVSTDIAENSSVMCSLAKADEWHNSEFSTSVLGFLNAFVGDDHICLVLDDSGDAIGFKLVDDAEAKFKKDDDQKWSQYRDDLDAYNKEHGTDHKPEER